MNERLTIEVLAPYLPYELKVWHVGFVDITKNIEMVDVLESLSDECATFKNGCDYYFDSEENECEFQPILRPLSNLTKDQHIILGRLLTNTPDKHEAFARADSEAWLRNGMQPVMSLNTCLSVTQYLFSIHADVFGLIPKGLAIDINTLTK